MKLNCLTPMLWTENLRETVDFYTSVLGFECVEFNEEWGWSAMAHDEVDLMFARPNAHTPFEKSNFRGSFYFYPDDVDEIWNELKEKAKVAYEIENFEHGMREFAIYDNNGYLLQFGNEIKN